MDPSQRDPRLDRREFLRRGALSGLGVGLLRIAAADASRGAEPPQVRRRVRLGRTGLEIPDIGFGGSRLAGDEALVLHAFERGITHFDTAESYTGGASEETIGRALRGRREQVTIASKVEAGASSTRQELMEHLEGSLRRLRTDRIDVYFNHAVNRLSRIQNPEWAEFVERAKQQGKIRSAGMSGHGGRLIECLDWALDHGLLDVMLVAYNFGQDPTFHQKITGRLDWIARQPELPRVLAKAKTRNVGVIAMKTLRGARLNDMRPFETDGATFAQAAFRWVLSAPDVDALVVTMKSAATVDEYLGASGWTSPRRADLPLLARYEERNGTSQCRYGCNTCADVCPRGVPISDVLRTRMYAEDYGDLELARADYAQLGAGASPCLSCSARPCAEACPFGIQIPEQTGAAYRVLTDRA